jgi:adenylate cyclase
MEETLPRKLVAILYADVAGYSRLTGEDEDTTHRALTEYLDLISTLIDQHHGKVMHYAGDAVLAKFEAVVHAISAAVAIQSELRIRNEVVPDVGKIQFRIGVNSGDVIEDRGDIYGDGVNVAARLEGLSNPGGICISDAVRSAIGKKLGLDYEDIGEQEVKNITEPVRAYKILMAWENSPVLVDSENAVLGLPDKPSIVVLPFINLSADPEQDYFADGIVENITTALSRIKTFFVIARTSAFIFKNQAVTFEKVRDVLGVRYFLEGSVQKVGNSVRINVQLIRMM